LQIVDKTRNRCGGSGQDFFTIPALDGNIQAYSDYVLAIIEQSYKNIL
jgi:hypothetical protein